MTRLPVRIPSDGRPLLDIFSRGRAGPTESVGFSRAEIEQIRRTVGRTPEVMVKVTGGGKKVEAVAAHLSYISRKGEIELETDEGLRVSNEGQKTLLKDWHLELSSGQYRQPAPNGSARALKLVHNIVLSMPAPTAPDKVLAAAKTLAREKFALKHQYAMALHMHQQHPHVHLIVKAEDYYGHRLHIDKALLRDWRKDFARMMRDQGIAANATPRVVRGQGKRASAKDATFWAQRRADSYAMRERVESVVRELSTTGTVRDPAGEKLHETRRAVVTGWMGIADTLDTQGEIVLAGDVRYFAKHLPAVLTDRERLAQDVIRYAKATSARARTEELERNREAERSR